MLTCHPSAVHEGRANDAALAVARADAILAIFTTQLGADFVAYRNHVARVIHFSLALDGCSHPDRIEKITIAAAFHDLGIWTHRTFDYLAPSIGLAGEYVSRIGRPLWKQEIARIIDMHHKLTPMTTVGCQLAEAFRRADWVDVSLGLLRFGLTGSHIRQVKRAYPNSGFHQCLMLMTIDRVRAHPGNPLPMFKW